MEESKMKLLKFFQGSYARIFSGKLFYSLTSFFFSKGVSQPQGPLFCGLYMDYSHTIPGTQPKLCNIVQVA